MAKQLSVFLQNEPGKIASITRALYEKGVDLRALSIADTADFGILRMLVNDVRLAKNVLDGQHCMVDVTDVVIAAVPDVPGGLNRVLELMADNGINIEYMYSLIDRGVNDAYMVFRVDDTEGFISILHENGINTVSGEEIGIY